MEWDVRASQVPVKVLEAKAEISVPSTEGMPPLTDIKHKVKRRTRTGSLTAHYNVPEPRELLHRDNLTAMMPPLARIRRAPITGGSWDDNSVGHGSVAARMRRERNRAILRTQSSVTNQSYSSVDTHANVTSTLNLINTTSLSPLPSERYYDNDEWMKYLLESAPQNYHSAATKSSAGSMCNIPVTGYQSHPTHQPWDTLSIPELHSTKSCDRTCHRTHHRHSYSSGYANTSYLHSSPTSGCASIASSDLDSADFMYFNINDDSSYFDGDSLFADSLGIIGNNEAAFSTNILSLLEEGSISCRTPFPASDWPDSISELDFDCSEGKSDDVTNCDALSDIGPSCSSPPTRRRMAKRQSLSQSKTNVAEQNCDNTDEVAAVVDEECDSDEIQEEECLHRKVSETASTEPADRKILFSQAHPVSEPLWVNFSTEEKEEYLRKLSYTINQTLTAEEQLDIRKILLPKAGWLQQNLTISPEDIDFPTLMRIIKYLEEKMRSSNDDWVLVKTPEQKNGVIKLVKHKKLVKNTKFMNGFDGCMAQQMETSDKLVKNAKFLNSCMTRQMETGDSAKACFAESSKGKGRFGPDGDAPACSYVTQQSTFKMDTGDLACFAESLKSKGRIRAKYSLDEAVVKSRGRPGSRQETSSTKSADPNHADLCADPACQGCSSNLRRSNSDGNLPKSVAAEAQKEHRRQQRQARRWAKLMKTRQRKETRQLKKEHRSGLFVNEKKVILKADCEEECDVEIS